MNPQHVRTIAKSFIDLKDSKRLVSFNEFCRNKGGFLRADYFKIKMEIKNILTIRQQSDLKETIKRGIASPVPPLPLLGWERMHEKVTT